MRKHLRKTMVFFLASTLLHSTAFALDLNQVLKRPLIVGASVSADWASTSPGKRLARKYTRDIKTVAKSGRSSSRIWKDAQDELAERSIVIALDMFFWDSKSSSTRTANSVLTSLIAEASAQRIPLVIGDIPEIFPGAQPSRGELNQLIRSKCSAYKLCRLFSLDSLYKQISKNRGISIGGRFYSTDELLPDGIHPGDVASEEMSRRLEVLLRN